MAYLLISIVTAMIASIMIYGAAASVLLAFLAYGATGTLVLCSALVTDAIFSRDID